MAIMRPSIGVGGGPHGSPKPPRKHRPLIRRARRALLRGKPKRAKKLLNRSVGLPARSGKSKGPFKGGALPSSGRTRKLPKRFRPF